jgi:hypothetical protein
MGAMLNDPKYRCNFVVDSGQAQVYRINDNGGADFVFAKLDGRDIWICREALDQAVRDLPQSERLAFRQPRYDITTQPIRRALAAISTTDVMTVGINTTSVGICLNPAVPEARAAWYSLGFLLRRAAAVWLDIAESELDLGIQPIMDFSSPFAPPSARIFISDSLENGAGYSTHLGTPDNLETLFKFMLGQGGSASQEFYNPYVAADHEFECASSCHRCLREYGNMPYHPLLDWRLALDMAQLVLDASTPVDFSASWWEPFVRRVSVPYFHGLGLEPTTLGGLLAGISRVTNEAIILTHPLWDHEPSNMKPEVASAFTDAEHLNLRPVLRSIFRAVRFPYE